MGYRLNRLDEPVFVAGPKPMRTEFGIHQRLESCDLRCQEHTVRNLASNKLNCTEKIMVLLKLLRKRSFKWGITWWGLTTHNANMGRGWGGPLFYLHRPTALLAWPVERPYQVTPLFLTSFSQRFQFCHCFSSTIPFFIDLFFWTVCRTRFACWAFLVGALNGLQGWGWQVKCILRTTGL